MSQTTDKTSTHTKAHRSSLERVSLSFEYNESWQDARRSFNAKAAKSTAK